MDYTPHISLVGFMGSGKSTVGKALARILQRPLFDTDSLIETRKGKSVVEIFTGEGEEKFREYERQLLLELLNAPQPAVIVCGGGTPCFVGVMDILNAHAVTFYLHTPVDILYARLKNEAAHRPLLQGKDDLRQFIEELLAHREPFYQKATYTIHTAGKTVGEIAGEITA
ncbi:MAG: shikimate kinase [Prevotellaceae bacterium]|jgi:shikimate kinase|nr:shikimate kinase [Prevotellaceae bacterium]